MAAIETIADAVAEHETLESQQRQQADKSSGSGRGVRVLGRLDPADDGPGWRNRMKPA